MLQSYLPILVFAALGVIVGGAFVHAPDEADCKFCDYGAACGDGAPERAARKRADPRLRVYARLASHV